MSANELEAWREIVARIHALHAEMVADQVMYHFGPAAGDFSAAMGHLRHALVEAERVVARLEGEEHGTNTTGDDTGAPYEGA